MNRLRAVILIKKQPADRRIVSRQLGHVGGLGPRSLPAYLLLSSARRAARDFVAGSRRTSADDLG
jgi:hypothetical protein